MAWKSTITGEQAEAMRALGKKGMRAAPIAAMFGCPPGIVEDVLAGRTWRSGVAACMDCGVKLHFANRSGYCRSCVLTRCAHCREKLPAGRGNRRCRTCKAAERAERLARADRLCTRCDQPLFERRDHWCRKCRRAYNEGRALAQGQARGAAKERVRMPGVCEICREPAETNVCRSCLMLTNMWGRERVAQEAKRLR